MFVSEYFGLGGELDKKEIFDCILDLGELGTWMQGNEVRFY